MSNCFFVGTFRFRNVRLTGWLGELFKTKWRNLQMAHITMLQNINLTVFIRGKFISSKVLRGSYQFVLYTLATAIVFFLDLAFHVYFCKSFLNSQPKQWSVQSAIVNRAWLYKDQNRRDIFFLADNGMEFILIWHPYLLHHLNLF